MVWYGMVCMVHRAESVESSFVQVTMAVGSLLSVCTGDLPLVSSSLPPLLEFALLRFAVGFGAGGLYPVVAAISRESSQEHLANSVVALVFGPIGSVGLILPPLVVLFLSLTVCMYVCVCVYGRR